MPVMDFRRVSVCGRKVWWRVRFDGKRLFVGVSWFQMPREWGFSLSVEIRPVPGVGVELLVL